MRLPTVEDKKEIAFVRLQRVEDMRQAHQMVGLSYFTKNGTFSLSRMYLRAYIGHLRDEYREITY